MASRLHHRAFAAAFGFAVTVAVCPAAESTGEEMQATIAELRAQNATLQRSLVQANKAEKDGNDRLVQAASDLELARERTTELETAATKVIASVADYLRQAVVSDPDSRARLETALRELDAILGFRHKPRPEVVTGALQQAKVVSIDQESGLIVLNLGEEQGAKVGMTFDLFRAQQRYGKAVLADVRKAVAGAFVELDPSADAPLYGDTAVLRTE
jgi:hypothetical protein